MFYLSGTYLYFTKSSDGNFRRHKHWLSISSTNLKNKQTNVSISWGNLHISHLTAEYLPDIAPMAHCQSARLVYGRSWVRIRGRVIPITLKVVHTASLLSTRHWKDRVWNISHHAMNEDTMYRESHPRARERTHIPEWIGFCDPLSTKSVWHSCVSASTARASIAPRGLRFIRVEQIRKDCQKCLKSTKIKRFINTKW